ncbi:MAG: ThiF family adenylyltransferase [Gammaproteobacteria bacterium]|nr:ThiF family adenylyltransferase [Gammaproteobacteria bacterium]MCP5459949.1 ThiF family adenylyltransferase [Gammaproteobacteria bacterium]
MSPVRYSRQIALPEVGVEGQEKLAGAAVLVVGAGGLGCPVLQYLAAAGVGRLGILDPDRVEASNLHRQILYGDRDLGEPKVLAAARRIGELNPDCRVEPCQQRLDSALAEEWVPRFDVVVDGTDNFAAKYALSDACREHGRPLVSASIQGFSGYVACFCADAPSYRALFPEVPDAAPNCAEAGVLGPVAGFFGVLQAAETLKLILDIGCPLRGRLLRVNLLTMEVSTFSFTRAVEPIARSRLIVPLLDTVPDHWFVLDVRDPDSYRRSGLPGAHNIPLEQLSSRREELPRDQPILVYCQRGVSSERACRWLLEQGYTEVASLVGGCQRFE